VTAVTARQCGDQTPIREGRPMHQIRRRLRPAAVAVLVALIAAGCGDDSNTEGDAANPTTGAATETTASANCAGEPVKFVSVATLSGPLALASQRRQVENGLQAALTAVNGECSIGRPIEINVCDDQGDPNESIACGRAAADDGTLAYVGASGQFEQGITASGLPGIFLGGNNLFEILNEKASSVASGLTLILGSVSAAAAAGKTDYLMLSYDAALTRFAEPIIVGMAEELGVNIEFLWYPPDTTDFAPIAAQAREKDPDAIGLLVLTALPVMNALANEGISATETPVFTSIVLAAPEVIRELGDAAEGMYLITQSATPSHTENAGIQQMREEFEAAGLDPDDEDLGPTATAYWSAAHLVANALATLSPEQIASLDSDTVFAAAQTISPIDRLEMAPAELGTVTFDDIAALSAFRMGSRSAMVVHVEDGDYVPVSDWVDVTTPFEMEFE
jgi:ABC-type branched-subunit amino acid transport system substrate-binding protein